ncbi:unnamed protein product [Phyllotreta striolata]|uniref:Rho GTPase-activating protein 100F n=1 Tax=Phyllotreta striolata TaxID=444603 RepID=A0A9N9XRA4_PHYSR|nr:unnamed protein product [Phyllotreta striolata]
MQWRKLARSKITSGRSRTRNMLCCGRRKDNGREALDLTASPLRAPAAAPNSRTPHPPMVIQGDFRKVSGISSEIFKQIETIENDHDASTAAALEHVERRGEMIVRILEARQLGRTANGEAVKRFTAMQDAKHTVQFVEIVKRPGQTLGLYIREGNGIDRNDGVFISRIALESAVYNSGCLKVGDEILAVNLVDVTKMSLDDVVIIMSIPRRLVLATRQRKATKGGQSSPSVQPRAEHKPPPVVVIKRELREDETDDGDLDHRDSIRQRHTGDGREMSESRSRLGLGLSPMDNRHAGQQAIDSNGLDLYYNSRPPDANWGYQPPPPVITEQPKSGMQHFQPYERSYPNTLESLAEKVHSFGMSRRMSAGAQPLGPRISSQQSPSSHYYVQHAGTGGRRIMPRSGSDQHLPQTEYSDYTSITQAGRHSLLRSSLKSGSTLSRYNQRFVDQSAVAAQIAQAKYGSSGGSQYGTAGTMRRARGSLDYSSDTEATSGRAGYYYYGRNQGSGAPSAGGIPHSTIPTLGRQNSIGTSDITAKFNSLPRDARAASSRLAMNKRFGDRSVSLIQDEADGALSAPEMPSSIRRDRDEYRQWLSRTPSTSAIYEQIRASRDVLNQQRAARFTYSAENIHDALKNMESGLYGGYGRPGATSTLDRHFVRSQTTSVPARSLSTQHITSALSSSRSPSMRRMRQLLDLDAVRTGAPSPVPTPSGTLPRGQRQLDINPAEFLKYKLDKPAGLVGGTSITGLSQLASGPGGFSTDEPVSGMLWVHLLAGRGLRPSTGTSAATTPVTPSGGAPSITGPATVRDLYCVLECDRVHKARTVVRTGDLVFDWDESFELDLVNNKELDLLIYSWDPQYRHKLCYKGSVYLPTLLKSGPIHQLALKIEPRGTLYLRLRHTDSQTFYRRRAPSTLTLSRTTPLFGVDLETVVSRESKTGGVPGGVATGLVTGVQHNVPIIVRRCVEEVERRGLDIIGLYRLCGSATKKRILREAFERNSRSVDLSPDNVPDINVITGVLKDYLRELPEPLFTKCLYQMMVDALGVCLPDDPEGNAKLMFSILDCLPRINRATLIFLMDHLALVVSASDRNKMSAQNLATALAPPLMMQTGDTVTPTKPPYDADYQQPIGVLKYLLQIWPTPKHHHHSGRRGRPSGPRGDSRNACPQGVASAPVSLGSLAAVREPSRLSAAPFPPPPRSAASGPRGLQPQVPLHQTLGQSSASKGPYRPLSPRVGPQATSSVAALRPRQVIVSSPGSPSSSSDSQSGSESVKHCLPGRVGSPVVRASPSAQSALRSSPSVSIGSPGPRNSPSVSSLSRASPSMLNQTVSRSSSPAMQASSAGLNVTLGGATPSFGSTLSGYQSSLMSNATTGGGPASSDYGWNYTPSSTYSSQSQAQPPPTYSSTNPFLTGSYMSYTPGESNFAEKFNTIGPSKEIKSFFESYTSDVGKYSTLNPRTGASYDADYLYSGSADGKTNGLGTSRYLSDFKFAGRGAGEYESAGAGAGAGQGGSAAGLLHVEETPTPTSSIETEDSNTREVGEKDVEGDGEQSD